ncbi:MAG: DeoR/GlpR family DNA-binding transcription regulator [Bacillota bacterium]|nr:DeoR/GlpR family DNA-binding transcription regulator [Bacillota bacterium]
MSGSTQVSLIPAERHRRIVEYIEARRSAKIEELAQALGASPATIRRDLDRLAARGVISRTHGGAVLATASTAFEQLYPEKKRIHAAEKRRIGVEAASLVADGETLILDSGSTTLEIARNLTRRKNLTIITNDLFIACGVAFDPSTVLMVTGGVRREGFNVLIGPVAEDFLRQVSVNKTFLSADAVDLQHGVTNATFAEAALKRLIIEAAQEVVLVADHSKFGKAALAKVCPAERLHRVITSTGIPESLLKGFEKLGIPVTVV